MTDAPLSRAALRPSAVPPAVAAALVSAAAPALAQTTSGGVPQYDPSTLATNLLSWGQPVLTIVAIAITVAACAGSANEPRRMGGIVGAGLLAIGAIWGLPYAPTAMGIAMSAISRT